MYIYTLTGFVCGHAPLFFTQMYVSICIYLYTHEENLARMQAKSYMYINVPARYA